MRFTLALFLTTGLLGAGAAEATTLAMTCKNPFRFYKVRFDTEARRLFANDTEYGVEKVDRRPGWVEVSGKTGQDGPSYRAEFAPRRQIAFDFGQGQIDTCR